MLPGFAETPITVIDPGWRNVNGSKVPDWDHPTREETYEYCWATPAATEEDLAGRQNDVAGYFVLFPPEANVPHTSKVRLPTGVEYQIRGRPKPFPSITGNLDHIAAYVERWTG